MNESYRTDLLSSTPWLKRPTLYGKRNALVALRKESVVLWTSHIHYLVRRAEALKDIWRVQSP